MKKRNRVLETILCAALAVVVFWGYMFAAKDNGVFALEDIEGDRTALNAFAFEGTGGDSYGKIHYIWQDGELKTKYYAASSDELRSILQLEHNGTKDISKYFKRKPLKYPNDVNAELAAVPAQGSTVRKLTKAEELQENIRTEIEDMMGGYSYQIEGVATDAIDIYGYLWDYKIQKSAQFRTGLQLKGREYQIVRGKTADDTYCLPSADYLEALALCTVETEKDWYVIPATGEIIEGNVSLLRIPKEKMESSWLSEDAVGLYDASVHGTAEPIQTFSVNAENRILALEGAGENQLLLARTEKKELLLELYDTEGRLIDRLATGIEDVSTFSMDDVNLLQRENQLLIWLEPSKAVEVVGNDGVVYEYKGDGVSCFVAEQGKIRQLSMPDDVLLYNDYQDGKLLQIKYTTPYYKMPEVTYFVNGYVITVTDTETGELLYKGNLKTDFVEDYAKQLSAINIGQGEKPIQERDDEARWESSYMMNDKMRAVSEVIPTEGKLIRTSWALGETMDNLAVDY